MRKPNPIALNTSGLKASQLDGRQGLGTGYDTRLDEGLIQEQGGQVVHRIGVACPTCNKESGVPEVFGPHIRTVCPQCSGLGWLYKNPRPMMGLVTNISSVRRWQDFGFLNPGDCVFSPSIEAAYPPISDFDLITFTWFQPLDAGQVIVRGEDRRVEQELLMRDSDRLLAANEDRLLYRAAQAIMVVDENDKEYFEDTDFVFKGHVIRWLNPPPDRTRITVKYECFYDWICFASPFERYSGAQSIGQKVALRKVHVAFTSGDPHENDGNFADVKLPRLDSIKV